jgi:hypothetical protein
VPYKECSVGKMIKWFTSAWMWKNMWNQIISGVGSWFLEGFPQKCKILSLNYSFINYLCIYNMKYHAELAKNHEIFGRRQNNLPYLFAGRIIQNSVSDPPLLYKIWYFLAIQMSIRSHIPTKESVTNKHQSINGCEVWLENVRKHNSSDNHISMV